MNAGIPKSAPFAEDEIEMLNRVVVSANPIQRAWLSGFLAGIDAATGQAAQAAEPQAAEPLTILYATESGNAERLAADMARAARKQGLRPALVDMAEFDVAALAGIRRLVVIASTWGEGEPPARAQRGYRELMGEAAPSLAGLEYGVLSLGDTAYAQFCAIGRAIDERLAALGARRVVERVDCDLDFAEPAAAWIASAAARLRPETAARGRVIEVDFGGKGHAAQPEIVEAEIAAHVNLNSSQSGKQTVHIELAFEGAAPAYKPGDALDVFVENDPAYVDALLKAAGLASDDALRADLCGGRDVTTLSLKTLESYVSATGHRYARQLLESGEAPDWIEGRQFIDLIEGFPIALSAEQLRGIVRPLAPRAYSIASSRREVGEEAHLLVGAVRYTTHRRERSGVASGHLIDRVKQGARLRVKLRPNRHFALPPPDRDIVMVGPGTGVAPFRAFVQERRATGASGRNWLFFGDRRFTHDFLYQLEWQDALQDGSLTRLDLAFSRDTPEKIYVQHRLWEQRRDVVDWLENGGSFFVCGDAKAMAKDVRAMLQKAYADVKSLSSEQAGQAVAALERDGRYLQDVY